MIIQVLHCPNCQGTDIVRHGKTRQGKQRYRCREKGCAGRTFLLEYAYAGQSPAVKQQIVDMAMNASGIRDTARVLHVSPTTVINELDIIANNPIDQKVAALSPSQYYSLVENVLYRSVFPPPGVQNGVFLPSSQRAPEAFACHDCSESYGVSSIAPAFPVRLGSICATTLC